MLKGQFFTGFCVNWYFLANRKKRWNLQIQKRSVRKLLSGRAAIIIIATAASLLLAHERLHKQRKMQRQMFCCWPLQVWAPKITEQKIKQKSRLIAACSLAPSRPPSAQTRGAAAMTMVRTTTRWWWQWRYCAEHQTWSSTARLSCLGDGHPPSSRRSLKWFIPAQWFVCSGRTEFRNKFQLYVIESRSLGVWFFLFQKI